MSLFAIGDLHLHFQSELKAPGQLHEPVWKNHDMKFRQNCENHVPAGFRRLPELGAAANTVR